MRKLLWISAIAALTLLMLSPVGRAQTATGQSSAPPVRRDGWDRPTGETAQGQVSAPAPHRDISGIWEPARGPGDGIGGLGSRDMPADGKPGHEPSYTALGQQLLSRTKPGNGSREVLPAEIDDPVFFCNPQGMPREDLYELRTTQIVQMASKVLILYEFNRIWRVVWTDGRDFPAQPEPRWYGYSIGKWTDDYTFVVQTIGTDERTWIDKAGRPHSGDLHIEERFHRVDNDRLELTVTIDDPKMYTKPWIALNNFPMKRLPDSYDVREMICSPAETAEYNQTIGSHSK